MGGKETAGFLLFRRSLLRNVWPVTTWGRAVNVRGPVLDFCDSVVPTFKCLVLEDAQFPGEEPYEQDHHDKADSDNTDDEDGGEVEDNIRSNTANALGVDKANSDDILQTLSK